MAVTKKIAPTPKPVDMAKKLDKVFAEMDIRKATIEATLKCKVFPIVLMSHEEDGEFVLGFAKEPDLITELRIADKSAAAGVDVSDEACHTALMSLIIKGESDARIDPEVDRKYWKGAIKLLVQFLTFAIPLVKKK